MAYKQDDKRLIGKNLAKLREERGWTQSSVAGSAGYDRSVYTKWENGSKIPNREQIEELAKVFSVSADELFKNVSVAIIHTSALMKNKRILEFLVQDYANVIIPSSVMKELEEIKGGAKGKKKQRDAWQVMMKISQHQVEKKVFIENDDLMPGSTIDKIVSLANSLQEEQNGDVFIIHEDITLSLKYKDSLLLADYMAKRTVNVGYYTVLQLMKEWEDFDEIDVEGVNLDAYLPDGLTLLIDCIRCNTKEKIAERGGEIIPQTKILQKIQFLLDNGAGVNTTDRWQHCLTPVAHCVQVKADEIFDYLISRGADYNMGSRDTLNTSNFRMQNEGNTPLMIACYEGKAFYVKKLLKLGDISVNQQDGNGYTALIKVGAGRNDHIKKGTINDKLLQKYKEIYELLSARPDVDKKIRDRNNQSAEDHWNMYEV